ncbi:MAG: ATP-binding protein [Thermoplasmata archaeon]|nr:MAG: ATP-binding protein [Thermoplasmata archaeon]
MLGRIIGRSAGEITFRFSYNEDVKIGEILVAEDKESNAIFFLRVIDIKYGHEGPENWGLLAAGEMLMMDKRNEEYTLIEKERRLFKIGVCKPLGYVVENEFKKPKTIPSYFSGVRRPRKEDYIFLEKYMGDIEIGKLRSGESIIDIKVGIDGKLLPYHIGIFATTGMGKSNLMRVMAASIMNAGRYGVLIIDPHGEYYEGIGKGLKHHPLAEERLVVYSPNPEYGMNHLMISPYEINVSDVEEIFNFSEAQRDALYSLYGKYGKRWLIELQENDGETLAYEFDRRIQEMTFNVLKRRLERIYSSDIIHKDEKISIVDAIIKQLHEGKVVLVDTSSLYEYEELLIAVMLARRILNKNKSLFKNKEEFSKISPVLITVEEAQRVINEGIFAQIAREGRKFKVGLCAITQQPKLIKEEVLSQLNTFFILGLADEGDRNILKSSSKQDISHLEKEIQTLEIGEALITYPGAPFALPVKIHLYDEFISENAEKIKKDSVDEDFF